VSTRLDGNIHCSPSRPSSRLINNPETSCRTEVSGQGADFDVINNLGYLFLRAVLQRVSTASVAVDGQIVGQIGSAATREAKGLLVLFGVAAGDTDEDSVFLARKTVELRIFEDENGKMNKSLIEIGGAILVVSQFTLIADWRSGRRPGFSKAASPQEGERLYLHYVDQLRQKQIPVQTGIFGADMQVAIQNEGPVTLILDTREKAAD
jgi:D-aminoacyl-tRNA deacylase